MVELGRLTDGEKISTAELRALLDQSGVTVASYVSLHPGTARLELVGPEGHRLRVIVADS